MTKQICIAIMILSGLLTADIAFASSLPDSFKLQDGITNFITLNGNLYAAATVVFALIGFCIAASGWLIMKSGPKGKDNPVTGLVMFILGSLLFSTIVFVGAINATFFEGNSRAAELEAQLRAADK